MKMPATLTDPVALAEALIACESVTPATGHVFDTVEALQDEKSRLRVNFFSFSRTSPNPRR